MTRGLHWLRNDLRLSDKTALDALFRGVEQKDGAEGAAILAEPPRTLRERYRREYEDVAWNAAAAAFAAWCEGRTAARRAGEGRARALARDVRTEGLPASEPRPRRPARGGARTLPPGGAGGVVSVPARSEPGASEVG